MHEIMEIPLQMEPYLCRQGFARDHPAQSYLVRIWVLCLMRNMPRELPIGR
jgi:hypothetical protein